MEMPASSSTQALDSAERLSDHERLQSKLKLIWELTYYEKKAKYQKMLLGSLWNFLEPLFQMLVYYVLLAKVFGIRKESYALFLFLSLTIHRFALASLSRGTSCFHRAQSLIMGGTLASKSVILGVGTAEIVLELIPPLLLFLVLGWITGGAPPSLAWVASIPLLVLFIVFAYCNFLLLSCLGVYWPDLSKLISVSSGAFLVFCPVLYSIDRIPEAYRGWYLLNPLASFYHSIRQVLLYAKWPEASVVGYLAVFMAFYFVLSRWVYSRLEGQIVKYW